MNRFEGPPRRSAETAVCEGNPLTAPIVDDRIDFELVDGTYGMLANPPLLDLLVIAPHPDDAELGMGGAILKCKADGLRVGVLDLTDGEPTPFGSLEIRAAETAAATKILGLDWRGNLGLPNRSLQPTLAARAKLAGVIRLARPKWLFAYRIGSMPIPTTSPPSN